MYVFYSMWYQEDIIFNTNYCYLEFGATAMLLRSLKQVFRIKSAFYIRYLHINMTIMLILKLQYKASTS